MISLIVDDFEEVHDQIRALSKEFFPEINIIDTATTVKGAVEKINRFRPELLFLDVELPDGLGFQILKEVEEVPPYVVFISGHSHFAVNAFEFKAVYFIHKPIEKAQFINAVERAKESRMEGEQLKVIEHLLSGKQEKKSPGKLTIRSEERITMIEIQEVVALKASGNYTEIYLEGKNRKEVATQLLRTYEERLADHDHFLKVHRSWCLNLAKVTEVERRNKIAVMENTMKIPVSARYWKLFLEKLEEL